MRNTILAAGIGLLVCVAVGCSEEFSVKEIVPANGATGGGETVEIKGSGFQRDMGVSVFFGGIKADNVVVAGSETLSVTTPQTVNEGLVDVRISIDDGREVLMKGAFRYKKKTAMKWDEVGTRKSLREKPE